MAFLRFIANRILFMLTTLVIITALLYAILMMQPPEVRAELYIPKGVNLDRMTEEQRKAYMDRLIVKYGLNDPYPVQYLRWGGNLLKGEWGYSPMMSEDVWGSLSARTPVTAELTLYTLLLTIPFGLASGAIAGWNRNRFSDLLFRGSAYVATALPPFILALVMLVVFYVGLYWFAPERLGIQASAAYNSPAFLHYTGLATIDGLLNGRLDVTVDAFRHLAMPVVSLGLVHWATLGRVTRAGMIDEIPKEYTITAKSKGLSEEQILWKQVFPNVVSPALASSALSAASLVTGVFVVERIFNFHGVSEIVFNGLLVVQDPAASLGYTIYNVVMVLLVMLALDILRGIVDPRARKGWTAQ
jgi:peptide/nickel transport system permease protein